MNARRFERSANLARVLRAGFCASYEILIVVFVLAVIYWRTTKLVSPDVGAADEMESLSEASSDRPVYRIAATDDGRHLWVTRRGGEVELLDRLTGQVIDGRNGCDAGLADVSHSDCGSTSLLLGSDGSAVLYRDESEPPLMQMSAPSLADAEAGRDCRDVEGRSCSVSSDGSIALAVTCRGTVFGWSLTESKPVFLSYQLPVGLRPRSIRLDRTGSRLFVAGADDTSQILDARTGERLGEPLNFGASCRAAAWSHDGNTLALALSNGRIALWDVAQSAVRVPHSGPPFQQIYSIAYSRDGRWIAAAVVDRHSRVLLWDTESDAVYRLSGHAGLAWTLAFSAQGDALFTGSLDGTVREWSLSTFVTVRCLEKT